jgi:hypothetical protein
MAVVLVVEACSASVVPVAGAGAWLGKSFEVKDRYSSMRGLIAGEPRAIGTEPVPKGEG